MSLPNLTEAEGQVSIIGKLQKVREINVCCKKARKLTNLTIFPYLWQSLQVWGFFTFLADLVYCGLAGLSFFDFQLFY